MRHSSLWCGLVNKRGGTEGETFYTASQEVTLSCDTEDATIYYTIDGSEPSATNGRVYRGPFDIYQTTTVKAIAVKDDWKDSAVASATFTKANEIGPAINMLEVLPDNDKTHPWTVVSDVTHDGVSAVKSGEIEEEESTTLKVTVYGAGQLSFWWKTSCEPCIDGVYYDYATFYNGSTAITNLAGVTDWQQVEDDYIAGTDPTNMTSHLTSSIEMVDGLPVITWTPDVNEGGAKDDRLYKIWGRTNLVDGGEWEWPTNDLHRFFKVTVEMK